MAQERRRKRREKRRRMQSRQATAGRLGITVREVKAREVAPEDVAALLAEQPAWLVVAQEYRRTVAERQVKATCGPS